MNQPQTEIKSPIFVITGMHRSGTSLVASFLQNTGLYIGKELLEGNAGNAKGYFENVDFYKLHKDILTSQEISKDGWTLQENIPVDEQYVDRAQEIIAQNSINSLWGWKDPRTTLFLDFWANLLPDANFLLIYRAPWEVVDSLYRRADETFQKQPELAPKIWLYYNQKIINFYNQFSSRSLLANINTIVKYPEKYIEIINQKFDVNLANPVENIYDSSLFKISEQDSYRPSLINSYFPAVIEMYQELEARSWQPEQTLDLSWREGLKSSPYKTWVFQDWMHLRQTHSSYQALQSEQENTKIRLERYEAHLQQLETQLQQSQSELAQTQTQLNDVQTSIEQLGDQLQQSQSELAQTQTQLEQSQAEQEKLKVQMNQAHTEVQQRQMQLHQVQEELEQSEISLHQSTLKVEELQRILKQNQIELEQLQYKQFLAGQPDESYQLLILKAWHSYQDRDYKQMAQYLHESLIYKQVSRTEAVLTWLESFNWFSAEHGEKFDSSTLISLEEWKQLVRRSLAMKTLVKS